MRFMKKSGWDVTMISADGPELEDVINSESVPHIVIPLTRKITPFIDLKALIILYKELKRINPDIVHTHTPKAGIVGMLAAWLAKVPIRIHTVAGLPLEASTGIKRRLLLFIERITYLCSTEVWPNSKSLNDIILKYKLVTIRKLKVIGNGSTNGIDVNAFNEHNLEKEILDNVRKKIKYDKKNKYLLFVGRIVKDKGIEELIEAFQILKNKYDNLRLLLVGPLEDHLDPLTPKTKHIINNDKDILPLGFSNYVKYYMYLADIFVFPSHREGFPNVLMQAGLMQCPVVASRITGNIDIIDDGINGILHERANTKDLFNKIEYAILNPLEMNQKVQLLKYKIVTNFNRNYVQEKLLKNYERLLEKQ